MKDGTPAPLTPNLTTITHDSTTAEYCSECIINNVTTTDGGTYTCSIANPIGSDSLNILLLLSMISTCILYHYLQLGLCQIYAGIIKSIIGWNTMPA